MRREETFEDIISESLRESLRKFRQKYESSLSSHSYTIRDASRRLHVNYGKQIRPLLLILVAGTYGVPDDEVLKGAVFIELLHTATLMHDDVVDGSVERRGKPSANAIYGNKKAVLIGDFVLTTAIEQALLTDDEKIITRLAGLGKQLTEGELLQMDNVELGIISEEEYFLVIDSKTASLIRVSMEVGALLAGEKDEAVMERIHEAGTKLGLAFQIRDDIFDYLPTEKMGKPAGNDIREHKLTLPLIHAIHTGGREAEKVKKLLRNSTFTREQVEYLVDFTVRKGGIEYAEEQIAQFIEEAKSILREVLAPGESLDTLLWVCDYIGKRDR